MSYARQMLDTYPRTFNVNADPAATGVLRGYLPELR